MWDVILDMTLSVFHLPLGRQSVKKVFLTKALTQAAAFLQL